jgi:tRNA pseudouridine13 synthase
VYHHEKALFINVRIFISYHGDNKMAIIKYVPEDFVVTEAETKDFLPDGKFACFWMTKKDLSTLQALEDIASELKISLKLFSVAGNKDKRAITTQLIAVDEKLKDVVGRTFLPNITLSFAGFSDSPLHLGDLSHNHFDIVVRDCSHETPLIHTEFYPNYFGPQRFSSNNARIGELLIRGDYSRAVELIIESNSEYSGIMKDFLEENPRNKVGALKIIPKNLLKLYMHSFQSLLWNEMAAMCLKDETDFAKWKDTILPLPGFGIQASEQILDTFNSVLQKHTISERDFILRQFPEISLEGSDRRIVSRITLKNLVADVDEFFSGKKKIMASFDLEKGSYATVAIKFLVKEDVVEKHKE